MNETRTRCIGWLFVLELWLIWGLGSYALWFGDGAMRHAGPLRIVSVASLAACAVCSLSMARREGAFVHWQGTLQFVASWSTFPLFQAIQQQWIHHPADAMLLRLDRWLWGGLSLPQRLFPLERASVSDILSLAYLCFYPLVVLPVVWFSVRRRMASSRRWFLGLSLAYLLGYAGYLLVPAAGPYLAFPEEIPAVATGGPISAFLGAAVADGATGMDVFPSLHVGIAWYVTGFFWLEGQRRRAYRMVAVVLAPILAGICLATVYLRYHYGIDVLAGIVLGSAALVLARGTAMEELR